MQKRIFLIFLTTVSCGVQKEVTDPNDFDPAVQDFCASCAPDATCDVVGQVCSCPTGYVGDGTLTGSGCVDVDECAGNTNPCANSASCANTPGSYNCACSNGFFGDGRVDGSGCVDVDECATDTDDCATNALCDNLAGSFSCLCPSGYEGDGRAAGTGCSDINECMQPNNCDSNAICGNISGSYNCSCIGGFVGDGRVSGSGCVEIDECVENIADCIISWTCQNTSGGFTCGCENGFAGDGRISGSGCVDVDECLVATNDCVEGASCVNSVGSYSCDCATGYAGDGHTGGSGCADIDECTMNFSDCVEPGSCINSAGSYSCSCSAGFVGDGHAGGTGCSDIDECTENTDDCATDATCNNTSGSFSCGCNPGYQGDGHIGGSACVDIDECPTKCLDGYCINTPGNYQCFDALAPSPFQAKLFRINPRTWNGISTVDNLGINLPESLPGQTITGITSVAIDPADGTIYVTVKVSGVFGRVLCALDPVSLALQIVGNLGDNFSTIAFRGPDTNGDTQMFGVTGNGANTPETMFLIDKATAATTLAVALGAGADGEVIAYNPDDGYFYHWSGNGTVIMEKIEASAPYTVTSIPISGTTNGEIFGAFWNAPAHEFVLMNIGSASNFAKANGEFRAGGSGYEDDLRGIFFAPRPGCLEADGPNRLCCEYVNGVCVAPD